MGAVYARGKPLRGPPSRSPAEGSYNPPGPQSFARYSSSDDSIAR